MLSIFVAILLAAADPPEVLRAREVYGQVNREARTLATTTFTAQRRSLEQRSDVRAWRDARDVRKVQVTDRDDDGDVVTEYYYDGPELVFAYVAVKGHAGDRQVTRVEQRQYFHAGRMVAWLGGLEKAPIPSSDPEFGPEGAERLAAAAFYRDAARLAFGRDARQAPTLVAMEAGDTGCHLRLREADGRESRRLADFAVCEMKPSPVGRRVALTTETANVMADECQGDTSCKKTRRVTLVTSLKAVDDRAAPAAPPRGAQRSFCTDLEVAVFACRVGAKLASACVSRDASRTAGYLQYRFGKPDSRDALEIAVPEAWRPPARAAAGAPVAFAGGGGAWLRVPSGEHAYVLYSGIGRWGPGGQPREKQGIVVERGGKAIAHLRCTERYETLPEPEWFERLGVAPDRAGFDLPD